MMFGSTLKLVNFAAYCFANKTESIPLQAASRDLDLRLLHRPINRDEAGVKPAEATRDSGQVRHSGCPEV